MTIEEALKEVYEAFEKAKNKHSSYVEVNYFTMIFLTTYLANLKIECNSAADIICEKCKEIIKSVNELHEKYESEIKGLKKENKELKIEIQSLHQFIKKHIRRDNYDA